MENNAMSTPTHTVFVYGTLRRGQWNHHHIESSEFMGKAITKSKYALFANGIPFLSRSKAFSHVVGEIYLVDKDTLDRLDELEGHPNVYRREQAEVILDGTKEQIIAWIYFHDEVWGDLIQSGDFLK